jgi:hypothetical protein
MTDGDAISPGDAMSAGYEIAQLNIGRAVGPLDGEQLAGFMGQLDEINALAEGSPGFVWRLKSDSGNATDIKISDDPLVIVNLTVWRSVEDLFEFAYRSEHKGVFARRFEWFERWPGPNVVLWWQPVGTIPDVHDAVRRLELLSKEGPTPEAFSFKQRFPAPVAV